MEKVTINNTPAPTKSKVILENRNHLFVDGVTRVISANNTILLLQVDNTKMTITGRELHIEKLDVNTGEVEASGNIDSIKYNSSQNLLKKMFK